MARAAHPFAPIEAKLQGIEMAGGTVIQYTDARGSSWTAECPCLNGHMGTVHESDVSETTLDDMIAACPDL